MLLLNNNNNKTSIITKVNDDDESNKENDDQHSSNIVTLYDESNSSMVDNQQQQQQHMGIHNKMVQNQSATTTVHAFYCPLCPRYASGVDTISSLIQHTIVRGFFVFFVINFHRINMLMCVAVVHNALLHPLHVMYI
jgi:hypothetical protein